MIYLLDTNACIEYLRGRSPPLVSRVKSIPTSSLRACSVVRAELMQGALRTTNAARNTAMIEGFLAGIASLPFDDAAADIFARIRTDLEALGTPIGPLDLQIAAIAFANQCTLVTHNVREFARIRGLTIEDWQV